MSCGRLSMRRGLRMRRESRMMHESRCLLECWTCESKRQTTIESSQGLLLL